MLAMAIALPKYYRTMASVMLLGTAIATLAHRRLLEDQRRQTDRLQMKQGRMVC
jgi:hypothetical protein